MEEESKRQSEKERERERENKMREKVLREKAKRWLIVRKETENQKPNPITQI